MATTAGVSREKLDRVPVNITLPRKFAPIAKAAAKREGQTLSTLVEMLLRAHVGIPPAKPKPTRTKGE